MRVGGWTVDVLRSWTGSMSTILPRKLHEQNRRCVRHGDCSSERNQRSFSWHSLEMLWHFSIIDTPFLLHSQQHQWLFFPSYRSLQNKGMCWFSRLLFSPPALCLLLLLSLESPPAHVHSSQQCRNLSWDSGLWQHQHSQRRTQSCREHVRPPRGAPVSTSW